MTSMNERPNYVTVMKISKMHWNGGL